MLADKYHHVLIEVDPPEQKDKNGALTISAKNPLDGDSEQTLSVKVQGSSHRDLVQRRVPARSGCDLVDQDTIVLDSAQPEAPGLFYPHGVDARPTSTSACR